MDIGFVWGEDKYRDVVGKKPVVDVLPGKDSHRGTTGPGNASPGMHTPLGEDSQKDRILAKERCKAAISHDKRRRQDLRDLGIDLRRAIRCLLRI